MTRAKLVSSCAALLLLGAALAAREPVRAEVESADLGMRSPAMWRAFEPLVVAFGGGDAQAAVAYLRSASAILRKAEAQLARDAATESFRKRALASLEAFDLSEFYQLLPNVEADGFRAFSFEGEAAARSYRVRAGMKRPPGAARAFGESYGLVRMRPSGDASETRYLLQLRGGTGLGPVRWQSLVAGAVNAGGLLKPPAEQELPVALRAADAYLRKRQPALGALDRRVLALLWGSYPSASDLILPISYADDVVAEGADPELAELRLVTRWDLVGMARKYPALSGYFKELGNIADARAHVADAAGGALIKLHADTEHMATRVGAVLRGGKLVAARAGAPSEPNFEQLRVRWDLRFVLHRLQIAIDKLQFDVRYRELADGFELSAVAVGKPSVRVSGAAFGLLPARLLDWFIPGDTEGLARRMLDVSMAGNQGRGMRVGVRFKESPAGASLDWQLETELLDTPLVRFCMAVVGDAAVPSAAQEADMRRLAIDYRNAFDADLSRFAKFGAPAQ